MEFDRALLMSDDSAEEGRIATGGMRVAELVLDCKVSLMWGLRGRSIDSATGTSVCLLLDDPREGPDEVDDA